MALAAAAPVRRRARPWLAPAARSDYLPGGMPTPDNSPQDGSIDGLLHRWRDGDAHALDRLLPLIYADLRRLAASVLRGTPGHATLQTTALVHEALLRVLGVRAADYQSPSHLLNASARMMRQILVDRARAAYSQKRGGGWHRDEFSEMLELPIPDGTDLDALNEALTELESAHERMAKVVELRYFVGLTVIEVAQALGITERTAHRDWAAAREWLRERLAD